MQQIQTFRKGRRLFSLGGLSGLEQWLDASQLTGLSDSDVLTNWPDLSGHGRNIVTLTGSPQFKTNIFGSLPAVTMGSGQGMTGTYSIASGSFSMVLVSRLTSLLNDTRRLINGSNNWLIGPWQNQWLAFDNANFLNSGQLLTLNPIIVIYTSSASGQHLYVGNIGNITSNTGGNFPGTVNFGITGSFAESFLGNLAEVGIFSRELTTLEVATIFSRLGAKWGA